MTLEKMGYTVESYKARKVVFDTVRVDLFQKLSEKNLLDAEIRMVDVTFGEVEVYQTITDLMMSNRYGQEEMTFLSANCLTAPDGTERSKVVVLYKSEL